MTTDNLPEGSWLLTTPHHFMAMLNNAIDRGADEEAALFYVLQMVLGHLLEHQSAEDLQPQISANLELLAKYQSTGGEKFAH